MSALLASRQRTGVCTVVPVSSRCTSSSARLCFTSEPYMCASMTCCTSKYGPDDRMSDSGQCRAMNALVCNGDRVAPQQQRAQLLGALDAQTLHLRCDDRDVPLTSKVFLRNRAVWLRCVVS